MSGIGFGQSGISPRRVRSINADSTDLYGLINLLEGSGIDISVNGQNITIDGSQIREVASDPPSGRNSEMILNTTTHQIKVWYNSTWQVLHNVIAAANYLLMETGDKLLLETGDKFVLET